MSNITDVSWQEFYNTFSLVEQKDIYYIEKNDTYIIWTDLKGKTIQCEISLTDPDEVDDKNQFESLYKLECNQKLTQSPGPASFYGKSFFRKSWKYNVIGGQTNIFSKKFETEILFFGGIYEIKGEVADGDYIQYSLTDEDNILGFGAGFELSKFIDTEYIMPGVYDENNIYKNNIIMNSCGKIIPNYFYLTLKYISVGSSPGNDLILIERQHPWR